MRLFVATDSDFNDNLYVALSCEDLVNYLYEISYGIFHYYIYSVELNPGEVIDSVIIDSKGTFIKTITTE